jgi:hypothetical protein
LGGPELDLVTVTFPITGWGTGISFDLSSPPLVFTFVYAFGGPDSPGGFLYDSTLDSYFVPRDFYYLFNGVTLSVHSADV